MARYKGRRLVLGMLTNQRIVFESRWEFRCELACEKAVRVFQRSFVFCIHTRVLPPSACNDRRYNYKLASWSSGYRTSAGRLVGLGVCGVSSFIPVARYTRGGDSFSV